MRLLNYVLEKSPAPSICLSSGPRSLVFLPLRKLLFSSSTCQTGCVRKLRTRWGRLSVLVASLIQTNYVIYVQMSFLKLGTTVALKRTTSATEWMSWYFRGTKSCILCPKKNVGLCLTSQLKQKMELWTGLQLQDRWNGWKVRLHCFHCWRIPRTQWSFTQQGLSKFDGAPMSAILANLF